MTENSELRSERIGLLKKISKGIDAYNWVRSQFTQGDFTLSGNPSVDLRPVLLHKLFPIYMAELFKKRGHNSCNFYKWPGLIRLALYNRVTYDKKVLL